MPDMSALGDMAGMGGMGGMGGEGAEEGDDDMPGLEEDNEAEGAGKAKAKDAEPKAGKIEEIS